MMIKRYLGLDGFDLLIHVGITAMLMVVAATAANGPDDAALIAMVVAASLGLLAWRRTRALRQMGTDTGEERLDRLHELEHRIAELEIERGRVLELEERLDFTERLLTQQQQMVRQLGIPRLEGS